MKHDIRLVQLTQESIPTIAKIMGVAEDSVQVVFEHDLATNMTRFFQIEYVNNEPVKAWFCRPE